MGNDPATADVFQCKGITYSLRLREPRRLVLQEERIGARSVR
ncbi:hypothetical protein [Streptomyces venezuelae]|nr:hypothetical protein [Streptomyces venezuelae]